MVPSLSLILEKRIGDPKTLITGHVDKFKVPKGMGLYEERDYL